jgi:hypothetical protein
VKDAYTQNSLGPRGTQSTYQAVVDIIKREGPLGLYSGLSSSLLGIAVTNRYVMNARPKS